MMKISTGTGLCVLGACTVAFPFAQRFAGIDRQVNAGLVASRVTGIGAAAVAQAEPTIVWYDASSYPWSAGYQQYMLTSLRRAWSDGRVEMRLVRKQIYYHPGYGAPTDESCADSGVCMSPWFVISDANQGYNSAADINFDAQVDGDDLGQLLAAWGAAPRHDVVPSTCPLNLINP